MPFIVFNKRTGKYLKRHSGSYRDLRWRAAFQGKIYNEVSKEMGPPPPFEQKEDRAQYDREFNSIAEKLMFSADPGDARVYANEGSAMSSVGVLNRGPAYRKQKYKLPDHLELHEIKEAFICVMRPDGSSNCDEDDEN